MQALYYPLCVAISQRIFESQYNIVNLNSFTKMNSEGEVMYKQRIIELNQSSHSRLYRESIIVLRTK